MLTYAIYCIDGCASASLPLSEALSSGPRSAQKWFCYRISLSSCCMHAVLTDAYALRTGSDLQETPGDTHDKTGTDAAAFLVLALISSFVPLIDCLLPILMFSVMRMFSEQEAVALVLSALLNELLKFRAGIRVGLELQQIQAAGHIVFSSRCCRSWQNLDTFDFIGISCSHQENAKD